MEKEATIIYLRKIIFLQTQGSSSGSLRIKNLVRIGNAYLKELRRLRFEKAARIVHSLRGQFKLKDILAAVGFPKATYMYWQKRAIEITSDCPYRRTFHSDRGWAYQMNAYSSILKENKIFQSMSRKGNCYDNSVMENLFGILKQEMYYGTTYYSFGELKETIEKHIKYYNEKRIKEKLGWMSLVALKLLRYIKSNFFGGTSR